MPRHARSGLAVVAAITIGGCAPRIDVPQAVAPITPDTNPAFRRLLSLSLPTVTGSRLTIWYSPQARSQADSYMRRVEGAASYLDRVLRVRPILNAAVLDSTHTQQVNGSAAACGFSVMHGGSPFLIVAPASGRNTVTTELAIARKQASARTRQQLERWSTDDLVLGSRETDLVVYHELGHVYLRALRIRTHQRWLDQWLATYVGYLYMRAVRPDDAAFWDAVNAVHDEGSRSVRTSLEDYEIRAPSPPRTRAEIIWYHAAFSRGVRDCHDQRGVGLLMRAREVLQTEAERSLELPELLRRMDSLCPGMTEWAQSLRSSRGLR